jgi:hypothetical protein
MSRKSKYQELVKNDPNFHDIRAKILLDAAQHLKGKADMASIDAKDYGAGIAEASAELRRMASNSRRAHNKHQDILRKQREASEAKSTAFGY